MKRINNSTVVGIFVLAAAFLGMGTIIFVASMKLFSAEKTLLVYFDESVNGLSVGAPVKYKGVPIGKVKNIMLSYNQKEMIGSSYIPVFLQLDLTKMGRKLDRNVSINFDDPLQVEQILNDGMRAKLVLESIITGQLYVELDYFAQPGSEYVLRQLTPEYIEIPSVPSDMEAFGTTATDILAQFASMDIKEINSRLVSLMAAFEKQINSLNVTGIQDAFVNSAESFDRSIESMGLQTTMEDFRVALRSLQQTADKLENVVDPAVENYHETLDNINGTLERANLVLQNIDRLTRSDGKIRTEILDTLEALERASRSAEQLISYLERNPNSILSGRGE